MRVSVKQRRRRCPRGAGLVVSLALLALGGCGGNDKGPPGAEVQEEALVTVGGAHGGPGAPLMTRLGPEETGIRHQNVLPQERTGRFLHAGAGVAAGDYDGDGRPDIYLVSETGQNHLYRNLGDWRFEDTTVAAGVVVQRQVTAGRWDERFPTCAKFFDADGDGDLDLFVCAFAGAATLFRNNGDGTFADVTAEAGVGYVGASTAAAVADYDRDGDLDLYVATYRPFGLSRYFPSGTAPADEPELRYDIEGPLESYVLRAEADALYRNRGDGTFEEVSRAAGIAGRDFGLAAKFADVDADGWPDLYVANDFETPDRFYRNDGDGTFSEMPVAALRHTPWFSMGMDFGDINNDGVLDLVTSDMVSRNRVRRLTQSTRMVRGSGVPPPSAAAQLMRNSLFLGNGDGTWTEVARYAGVAATEWTWTVKFADIDLDGRRDLLVTNGFVRDDMNADEALRVQVLKRAGRMAEAYDLERARPPLLTSNFAFRNIDGLRFEDVSEAWGFDDTAIGNGMALADFDGDGDLDAVVNNMNAVAGVYRNDAAAHRLKVGLRGDTSNSMALGARLTLEGVEGVPGVQVREMSVGGGYMSGHEPVVVFGMGEATVAGPLTIDWPSGHRTVVEDVTADRYLRIAEPKGPAPSPGATVAPAPQFSEVAADLGIRFRHDETGFDDLTAQPLLPLRLSRLGPGVAWGDWNDDGWDDLAVAGARGQATRIFVSRGGDSFEETSVDPVPGAVEAMAPLFVQVAGAQGLLETASRVESPADEGVVALQAASTAAASANPRWQVLSTGSASALAAADYNGDGLLDAVVANLTRPGRYPMPVSSLLFRGTAAGLVPSDADAPALAEIGAVTAALWSDVDGDGDPDLVLASHWGPVRLLRNDDGRLSDATADAGLDQWPGLWNGLATGDVDHDGDLDLVATNFGWNTIYRASPGAPAVLLGGDMDGDGDFESVETEWEDGRLYSMRSRLDVQHDVASTWERFGSFRGFARGTVEEVFSPEELAAGTRFEATVLGHTLFLNDGSGAYEARPLPAAAQMSVGFGVVVTDLDNDGHDDIFVAHNLYGGNPVGGGRYDGGVGQMLRGDGRGGFEVVSAAESGLSVPGDAKGLAVTDFDQDGWVDVAVGINDGPVRVYRNHGVPDRRGLVVKLAGARDNPRGVGAWIRVERDDGLVMLREVHAGSSYLSQNGTAHTFGMADTAQARVTVRWPDGAESVVPAAVAGDVITISPAGAP